MGRFAVTLEVANLEDMYQARNGSLALEWVRRLTIDGVVDSGATRLVLPAKVVKELGLKVKENAKAKVRTAGHRRVTREIVQEVYVAIQGRHGTFSAIVEPRCRRPVVGAIVLEELDFLMDFEKRRLVPRDPKYVVSEIE